MRQALKILAIVLFLVAALSTPAGPAAAQSVDAAPGDDGAAQPPIIQVPGLAEGQGLLDIFRPNTGDETIGWLIGAFGVNPFVSGDEQVESKPLLAHAVQIFNAGILFIAMMLLSYKLIVGVVQTAHDGELLGRHWSTLWGPTRVLVGAGALLPLKSGFCLAQLLMLYIASMGVGFANHVWLHSVKAVMEDSAPVAAPPIYGAEMFGKIAVQTAACMVLVHDTLDQLHPEKEGQGLYGQEVAIFRKPQYNVPGTPGRRGARDVKPGQGSDPSGTGDVGDVHPSGAVPDIRGEYVRYYYQGLLPPLDKRGLCGHVEMARGHATVEGSSKSQLMGDIVAAARDKDRAIGSIHSNAFKNLLMDFTLALAPVVRLHLSDNLQSVEEMDVRMKTAQLQIEQALVKYNFTLMNQAAKVYNAAYANRAERFVEAATSRGWSFAGAWWLMLSRYNSRVKELANAKPDLEGPDWERVAELCCSDDGQKQITGNSEISSLPAFIDYFYFDAILGQCGARERSHGCVPEAVLAHAGTGDFTRSTTLEDLEAQARQIMEENREDPSLAGRVWNTVVDTTRDLNVVIDYNIARTFTDMGEGEAAQFAVNRYDHMEEWKANGVLGALTDPWRIFWHQVGPWLIGQTMPAPEEIEFGALTTLQEYGQRYVTAAISMTTGGVLIASVGGVMDAIPLVGGAISGAAEYIGGLIISIAQIILLPGIFLGYVLPLLPFAMWVGGLMGWLLLTIEAVIAAPLWALAHIRMDGEGLAGPTGVTGYKLVLSLFLRPALMILGLILGVVTFDIMASFLSRIWEAAAVTAMGVQDLGIFGTLFGRIILTILLVYLAFKCFSLIYQVPDRVLRWIEGQAEGLGEEEAIQRTTGVMYLSAQNAAQTMSHFADRRMLSLNRRGKGHDKGKAREGDGGSGAGSGGDATDAAAAPSPTGDRSAIGRHAEGGGETGGGNDSEGGDGGGRA